MAKHSLLTATNILDLLVDHDVKMVIAILQIDFRSLRLVGKKFAAACLNAKHVRWFVFVLPPDIDMRIETELCLSDIQRFQVCSL